MGGVLSIFHLLPFLCSVLNLYETTVRGVRVGIEACASIDASAGEGRGAGVALLLGSKLRCLSRRGAEPGAGARARGSTLASH
jgi:hypothetical protein